MIGGRLRLRSAALLAIAALLLAGCAGPRNGITVTASFDDVVDLVVNAGVRLNNVTVGRISAIELRPDHRALVTMELDRRHAIPADVHPVLARTSVLGERYIDLVPQGLEECVGTTGLGCLAEGDLGAGAVRADLEDLVQAGTDLLSVVTADAVSAAIRTGAEVLSGREELIGGFITDLRSLATSFNENSDDLLALIDALDGVTAAYAANADVNAATLADLRRALSALEDLDDQLLDTLDDLTALSDEATSFLVEHQDELHDAIRRLRLLVQQVELADADLRTLLQVSPGYLRLIRKGIAPVMGEERSETQVWLDIIICGLNDTPGDPSRACDPPNPGQPGDGAQFPEYPEECWDEPELCDNRREG